MIDNNLKAVVLAMRLEAGEQLTQEEMLFLLLHPQTEYSKPYLAIKKRR